MDGSASELWQTLRVEGPDDYGVAHLFLNRPFRSNALDSTLFRELPLAIAHLDARPSVRIIVLRGSGKNFCSGIDLSTFANVQQDGVGRSGDGDGDGDGGRGRDGGDVDGTADGARGSERTLRRIKLLQASFTSLEDCRKPVIAAIHGACIGAGVDMVTACDLRYCSFDSYFSVKEVDLAIVADLGTLQRLPSLVGHGNAMELALTGRKFSASEAKRMGLVHDVFGSKGAMEEQVNALARNIAAKSPLAVVGTKRVLLKSRDLSVRDGLDYVATWNSAMLMSSDLKEAMEAQLQRRKPTFSKL